MQIKTKDWPAITTPKVLIIGENSTFQWSDEVVEYVMFLDYYFNKKPYDHGQRSRYMEARNIFAMVTELTDARYRVQEVYATNLSLDLLQRAPKGKRLLVPEAKAKAGIKHIEKILADNPTIEVVFALSVQVNYWLQQLGFCQADERFLHGGQPRTVGLTNFPPYYQPVDAKTFEHVCGKRLDIANSTVKLIPLLAAKDYPLRETNIERYGKIYQQITSSFAAKK